MTDRNKQLVSQYVASHDRSRIADIVRDLGISHNLTKQLLKELVASGKAYCKPKFGYFRNQAAYLAWFEKTRQERSEKASIASKAHIGGVNIIFEQCRSSDAMQRVLAFYGRVQA
ncbi:DUF977 family protein [Atlantibacter hermannii]|uniref:DUF977 family protein n=1 Tax=Atlantibacter hermannii TaxID=565 RepID=UPI0028A77716|nr:DUF977 family protein [Atlantibacter hermannii]